MEGTEGLAIRCDGVREKTDYRGMGEEWERERGGHCRQYFVKMLSEGKKTQSGAGGD